MSEPASTGNPASEVAPRPHAHLIVAELKTQVRRRTAAGRRDLVWSVNVGHIDDATLDEAMAAMARIGCRGSWEREFGFVAHYTLTW
ncbi:hypothetical protein V3391_06460 [Luteimonas sp. SMYT11W]|uniref:Uncharacterized protein n=1 Tax=Luteimonas flava TaxID=3115822 RepID=A0ABU7WCZ8_9GAMM